MYVCVCVCNYVVLLERTCDIIYTLVGQYTFKVELTKMTAAGSVELWISDDSDPLSINKVLELVYDDMVS